MKDLLDKYGIFIQHLEKVSVDESYKSADRNKFIMLATWERGKVLAIQFCYAYLLKL